MIVGIDIGQESSQICYYDEQQRQPVSVSVVNSVDNRQKYQFGFMLSGANQDNLKELLCTLLALLPKNGRKAGERDSICVTVSDFSKPVLEKLSAAVQLTGYAKENWSFISHEEAYAYYAFSQKKELYVNGAVLLDYREDGLHTHYMTIVKKSGQEMIPEESHVYSSEMICSVPQRRKTLAQAEKELIHCVQDAKKFREWDLGFDFYAPQTLEAPDGRRILFGWAGVSDSPYDNEPSIREGWQHSMTVPRELFWKGGILCQKPVRELEALRKDEIVFEQGEAEIHGGAFDLVAERDIAGEIPVRICFNQELQITYGHGVVSMEFLNNTGSGRTIRKARLDGLQNVRILMDVSLMEVYFNDGELVMTSRYYPEDPMTTKVSISGMEQVKGWTMAGQ